MKVQPTTKELIAMLYERLPELFDRAALAAPVQEPVIAGSLSVRYFRGCKSMTNTNFDYEGDLPEGDYTLYTTPPAAPVQEPVAWMEMVVANLVREGVNKHKARELAQHFYTTPPAAQPASVSANSGLTNRYTAAQPAVPEGTKLAPVKPTYEMVTAGADDLRLRGYDRALIVAAVECYSVMLAAAPEKCQP